LIVVNRAARVRVPTLSDNGFAHGLVV
jgi:hypothetical protein